MRIKLLISILSALVLTSCATYEQQSQTWYFQHYERCANIHDKLEDIYQCGNYNRSLAIAQSPNTRSPSGDHYENYINQLVKAVRNGSIKEDNAKLEFYKVTQQARSDAQQLIMAAYSAAAAQQAYQDSLSYNMINQGMSLLNGNTTLGGTPNINSYSSGTVGGTYYFSHDYMSGANKICVYKSGPDQKVMTVGAAGMCPLSY